MKNLWEKPTCGHILHWYFRPEPVTAGLLLAPRLRTLLVPLPLLIKWPLLLLPLAPPEPTMPLVPPLPPLAIPFPFKVELILDTLIGCGTTRREAAEAADEWCDIWLLWWMVPPELRTVLTVKGKIETKIVGWNS